MALVMAEIEFDWREFAACSDSAFEGDNHPFFAEGYGTTYPKARMYCASCPVVVDCLIEGVSDADNEGMWGCMSPNERREIRRKMGEGYTLRQAAEAIWSIHRRKANGEMPVPRSSVWKEWNA